MEIESVILWSIMGGNGLKYLREHRHIKPHLNGNDIINLGYSGQDIGKILDKIIQNKLINPNMTKAQELELIQK